MGKRQQGTYHHGNNKNLEVTRNEDRKQYMLTPVDLNPSK